MQLCLCCAHTIVYKKEYLSENELATCTSLTTQGLHTNYLLWKPWHAAQNETWRWDPRHHLFLIAAYRCQPDPRSMTCGWRASHPKCSACSGPAEDRALVWNVKGETLCHVNMITNTWGLHEGYTVATSEITNYLHSTHKAKTAWTAINGDLSCTKRTFLLPCYKTNTNTLKVLSFTVRSYWNNRMNWQICTQVIS